MKAFIDDEEIVRVELEEGEWIDVVARFSYGQLKQLRAAGGNNESAESAGERLLLAFVKGWSFKDNTGQVPPVTIESLNRLDGMIINKLNQELLRLNPFLAEQVEARRTQLSTAASGQS